MMRSSSLRALLLIGLGVWWAGGKSASAQDSAVPPPPLPGNAAAEAAAANAAPGDMEVMTRGPIHEAYAQPVNSGEVRELIVPKQPPQPIEEIPPDTKPDDPSAVWISGYWSWDDDRKDYMWVSGVWRVPPPGHRWISGYWADAPGGYRWVAGFWAPLEVQTVDYHPAPPVSLEQGPTSAPPAADYVWVTGCWRWAGTHYVWQPGYWAEVQQGWIWVPASYSWCPRGWVFCPGYWDYPLSHRGLMFAPVYFTNAVYLRPHYVYSPAVVIDAGLLTFHLFIRPSYCHYYFGDYYAAQYDALGIYPWYAVHVAPQYNYDPLFAYYDWYHKGHDPGWLDNLRGWHDYYRAHPEQCPPRDLAAQQRLVKEGVKRPDAQFLSVATSLKDWRARPDLAVKLTAVSPEQRVKLEETNRLMRQVGTERWEMETRPVAGVKAGAAAALETPLRRETSARIEEPQKLPLPKTADTLVQRAYPNGVPNGGNTPLETAAMKAPGTAKPKIVQPTPNAELAPPVHPAVPYEKARPVIPAHPQAPKRDTSDQNQVSPFGRRTDNRGG